MGPSAPRRRHDPGRESCGQTDRQTPSWLVESDAVLGAIACCLRRVPVELDPHGSQLAPERAMLERGEQCVELGKMDAMVGFELIDLGHTRSEGALQIERWINESQLTQDCQVNILLCKLRRIAFEGGLNKREPLLNEFCSYVVLRCEPHNTVGKVGIKG